VDIQHQHRHLTGNTTYTAIGHGTDPLGNDYTYPPNESERDTLVVTVITPGTSVDIKASGQDAITIETAATLP